MTIASAKVAVVGAGCAGLAAARHLTDAGAQVTIFERDAGAGGRMATQCLHDRSYDHGAQFFSVREPEFVSTISRLTTSGVAAVWPARWGRFHGSHMSQEEPAEPRFVGVGGMNRIVAALAEGVVLIPDSDVTDLSRSQGHWIIEVEGRDPAGGFDIVILAVPAPEAASLLTGIAEFAIDIAAATYAPCWAVMAEFEMPLPIELDAIRIEDSILAWAARNSSKPGFDQSAETWVLHASPEWSLAYLDEPAEAVREVLLDRFRWVFRFDEAACHATAHRWRYALVQQSAGLPFFWDPGLQIGACGDWCLGPRVEAAFDSGFALAETLIRG